jgi:alpha-beta hydrolase superfamily lysophospholipase
MSVFASTLSTYTASDGDNIALHDWPLPEGPAPRGVVILVHGLGEHAGRHDRLARRLNGWGFAVRGYDQYGHGESGGVRGGLPTASRLLDDLADIVDSTRLRMDEQLPLILLGHSMGGLVAARFIALKKRRVDGLVLSSPLFDAGLGWLQKALLATLPRLLPNLALGNGVDAQCLSHDRDVVAAYRRDPLVHDRITGRLARFIADGGPAALASAARWTVPTLLLFAGDDRVVNAAGSRAFAAAARPDVVTAQCFEGLFHEIFNELDPEPVFDVLEAWLEARFAPNPQP